MNVNEIKSNLKSNEYEKLLTDFLVDLKHKIKNNDLSASWYHNDFSSFMFKFLDAIALNKNLTEGEKLGLYRITIGITASILVFNEDRAVEYAIKRQSL